MNTKNTVFSRLFDADKHKQLSLKAERKKRISLSVKDDVLRNADDFLRFYKDLDYVVGSVLPSIIEEVKSFVLDIQGDVALEVEGTGANNVLESARLLRDSLVNLGGKADELGLDPNDIVPNFSELDELVSGVYDKYQKMQDLYNELEEVAQFNFNGL
jgi:hypothetical protein